MISKDKVRVTSVVHKDIYAFLKKYSSDYDISISRIIDTCISAQIFNYGFSNPSLFDNVKNFD